MDSMKPLDKIYNGTFFKTRKSLAWRAPIVCNAIAAVIYPETIIDIGCAVGDLIVGFTKIGVDAWGLEGAGMAFQYLMCPKERVVQHDLRDRCLSLPIEFPKKFDAVVCFEVAEHIEPEYADTFVWNLQSLARKWIIMSAAPPGQGGDYHVNCQKSEYWDEKIRQYGFKMDWASWDMIRKLWIPFRDKKGIKAYYNNLLIFQRSE